MFNLNDKNGAFRNRSRIGLRTSTAAPGGEPALYTPSKRLTFLLLLCLAFAPEFVAPAAAANCCTITAIDLRTGVVTAEDGATKRRHRILMNNAVLVRRLALGQPVDIDAHAGKATIEGIDGRYALVKDTDEALDVIIGRDVNRRAGTTLLTKMNGHPETIYQ
jgi:hypothetical protein